MTAPLYPCSAGRRGARCLSFHALFVLRIGLALAMLTDVAQADNFANVYYDARRDQVVVTIFYRGTNPNHTFHLQWAQCKDLADGSERSGARQSMARRSATGFREDHELQFGGSSLPAGKAHTENGAKVTLRIPGLDDRRP